ncbi:hypothetical protein MD273_07190 [Marinobacter pelagius]|uniref:hypothetical protein n=1 Tax=Marinobacter sp. C7 TaxID=2951363 RepID=UPI001EEFF298|nr:hypothetical protein [Marinobacter sp. C7]
MKNLGAVLSGTLMTLAVFTAGAGADAGEALPAGDGSVTLDIAGISATTGEDEPRILYVLPWQPPSLPRRPRVELEDRAPELEQPLDPLVVERHRRFRETLDPMTLDPEGIQP